MPTIILLIACHAQCSPTRRCTWTASPVLRCMKRATCTGMSSPTWSAQSQFSSSRRWYMCDFLELHSTHIQCHVDEMQTPHSAYSAYHSCIIVYRIARNFRGVKISCFSSHLENFSLENLVRSYRVPHHASHIASTGHLFNQSKKPWRSTCILSYNKQCS